MPRARLACGDTQAGFGRQPPICSGSRGLAGGAVPAHCTQLERDELVSRPSRKGPIHPLIVLMAERGARTAAGGRLVRRIVRRGRDSARS